MTDTGRSPEAEAETGPHDEDAAPGAVAETPYLEVGTGFRAFEPLEPGQRVPIVRGIQGGIHVWGGFRGAGFDPVKLEISFELRDEGVAVGDAGYTDDVFPGDGGDFEYSAVAVIFYENTPELFSGRTMELSVQIRDRTGAVLSDAVEVIPECCE